MTRTALLTPQPAAHAEQSPRPQDRAFDMLDYGLYGLTIFAWSTSWYAITYQVDGVSPLVSGFYRFALATALMFAFAFLRGKTMRFPLATHLRFAGLGALIFSTNFMLFYYAAAFLPTGLLSVVFSLASIFNIFLGAIIFKNAVSRTMLIAGLIGFAGVSLMFLPEIFKTSIDRKALGGLLLCVSGTLSFCLGNMLSASNQQRDIPVFQANSWGMLYGTLFMGLIALVVGEQFVFSPSLGWLVSWLWLAVVSTILAFACYMTLIGRIGSARTGYITVIFPVFALIVSTYLEGYTWSWQAFLGIAMVLAGNVIVVRKPKASS